MYRYSTSPIDAAQLQFWWKHLENNDYSPTDASWASKVKVRDAAVFCLETMAGMEFFPAVGNSKRHEVAGMISYKAGDEVFRDSIKWMALPLHRQQNFSHWPLRQPVESFWQLVKRENAIHQGARTGAFEEL